MMTLPVTCTFPARSPGARPRPNPYIPPAHPTTPQGRTMVEFKAVVNDPKAGKSYQRAISGHMASALLGKKIGDEVDGLFVQLPGYKLQITGGSDKDGFPMRGDLTGPPRRGGLVRGGGGVHPPRPAPRQRKAPPAGA